MREEGITIKYSAYADIIISFGVAKCGILNVYL